MIKIYQQIYGEMVRDAALRTKGSGGPSGVDANGSGEFSQQSYSRKLEQTCAQQ